MTSDPWWFDQWGLVACLLALAGLGRVLFMLYGPTK